MLPDNGSISNLITQITNEQIIKTDKKVNVVNRDKEILYSFVSTSTPIHREVDAINNALDRIESNNIPIL